MKHMIAVKNQETFEVNIKDDSEIQYYFALVVKYIPKDKPSAPKTMAVGYTLDGASKSFPPNNELAVDEVVNAILGQI